MSITVVLAIGMDSWVFESQRRDWQSAGFFITQAGSVREAIDDFQGGDFDLILIGDSIPAESRESLTFMIRASGSRVPVVCVTNTPSHWDSLADATIRNQPNGLRQKIGELLVAAGAKRPALGTTFPSEELRRA